MVWVLVFIGCAVCLFAVSEFGMVPIQACARRLLAIRSGRSAPLATGLLRDAIIWFSDEHGNRATTLMTICEVYGPTSSAPRRIEGFCNYRKAPISLPVERISVLRLPMTGETFTNPEEGLALLLSQSAAARGTASAGMAHRLRHWRLGGYRHALARVVLALGQYGFDRWGPSSHRPGHGG